MWDVVTVTFLAMAGETDWVALIPAIIGAVGIGTVAGAVISTYGGRGRERREIRSNALASLEKIEITRRTLLLPEGPYYDLTEFSKLSAVCMIAGVPRSVIRLYDQVSYASRRFTQSMYERGGAGTARQHG
jgi:hypothetical protein